MSKQQIGDADVAQLAEQLSKTSTTAEQQQQPEFKRKEPTAEDFVRYKSYVGRKWTGVCKWFNVSKGFGFIVPDAEETKAHGDDVFVHQSSLQMPGFRSLDEGEQVEFTVRLGKRGLEAENVSGIAGAELRGHRIHPLGKRKEREIRCFNCGQFGMHKASRCKNAPRNVKACYICHSEGHLVADCPQKVQQQQQEQKARQQTTSGADLPKSKGEKSAGSAVNKTKKQLKE